MAWQDVDGIWKLFNGAQKSGEYFVVVLDGKAHKQHVLTDGKFDNKKATEYLNNIHQIMIEITQQILHLEQNTGKQIFHRNDIVKLSTVPVQWNEAHKFGVDNVGKINPNFCLGDLCWFILKKNTLTEKHIKNMFAKQLEKRSLPYEFWCASGYYQTDEYGQRSKQLWREDAILILTDLAKQKNNIVKANKQNEKQL